MPSTYPDIAYAVDFGTSNSTVSVEREGRIQTLQVEQGSQILRSVLYFKIHDELPLMGSQAIEAYLSDIAHGRSSIKKKIATGKYIKVVKPATLTGGWAGMEWVPEIIEAETGNAGRLIQSLKSGLGSTYIKNLQVFDTTYPIEEIIGMFLRELKKRADADVGANVKTAVIGHPVHFVGGNNKLAITRLEQAAKIAGFTRVRFEYEPVGAAWSYKSETDKQELCFVFDFGGGTLDFSLVEFPNKRIITNDGLPIGGDLLNSRIFESVLMKYFGGNTTFGEAHLTLPSHITANLKHWYLISLLKTTDFLGSLEHLKSKADKPETIDALKSLVSNNLGFMIYEKIDQAKKELSHKDHTTISFHQKGIDIEEKITRAEFEEIINEDLTQIKEKIDEMLTSANLRPNQIDKVITTGGSSLIPKVQELLKNKFSESKIENQDPFTSVSEGLALRAKELF